MIEHNYKHEIGRLEENMNKLLNKVRNMNSNYAVIEEQFTSHLAAREALHLRDVGVIREISGQNKFLQKEFDNINKAIEKVETYN
jgi:hypothetical protein